MCQPVKYIVFFTVEYFSVAFHATISVSHPVINIGDKVPFDNVKLNIGGGYVNFTVCCTCTIQERFRAILPYWHAHGGFALEQEG